MSMPLSAAASAYSVHTHRCGPEGEVGRVIDRMGRLKDVLRAATGPAEGPLRWWTTTSTRGGTRCTTAAEPHQQLDDLLVVELENDVKEINQGMNETYYN